MNNSGRKEMILDLLRNYSHFVTVEQLSEQLFVSSATIRRDLQDLENSGLIHRTRGGALLLESITTEAPMVLRENRNEMQKQIIANIARKYIKDGMTIFMDSSSTVFTLARNLEPFSNLKIITNNLKVIWLLSERKGITILCTGGVLKENSKSFLSESAVEYVRRLNADAAFLSAQGFSIEKGSSDSNEAEFWLKRAYISHSRQRYLLCDTSKMGIEYLYRTSPLSAYTKIITENREVNDYLKASVQPSSTTPSSSTARGATAPD
ncbi:MAG: DeoR/GlpR family DNA-binding transcription regulator [Clostridiales Family XIII bacterium]|jgi:DeoR/GlpR family transcriptional regulator of sugar metabolism|nr:DeoR/GlpR family DNA-binding transcription regulator [Clostridiales Family XIII bacterium]